MVRLEFNSSKDVYALQQKMSQVVWDNLRPSLSELFDKMVDNDVVIRLDKIEIDIGNIDLRERNFTAIAGKIVQLLEEQIKERLRNIISERDPLRSDGSYSKIQGTQSNLDAHSLERERKFRKESFQNEKFQNQQNSGKRKSETNNDSQSLRSYYFELWLHWLEKGALPSYALVPEDNWTELVFETLGVDSTAVTALANLLKKNRIALWRLVVQHSTKELSSIVELYTANSQSKLLVLLKELELLFSNPAFKSEGIVFRKMEISIWRLIFRKVILERKKLDSTTLGLLIIQLPQIIKLLKNSMVTDKVMTAHHPFLKELIVAFSQTTKKQVRGDMPTESGAIETTTEFDSMDPTSKLDGIEGKNKLDSTETTSELDSINETIRPDLGEVATQLDSIEKPFESDPHDIINEPDSMDEMAQWESMDHKDGSAESPHFHKNAGMVLLHPFLNNFFNQLKLLEEEAFKDVESQSKAVLLLYFMATGKEKPFEHELVLPKFLCCMATNFPIDRAISLSKKEKKEANIVLEAAIEHWEALGDTSPDGLREAFLMREGKLVKETSGWKLNVEQKALDLLLDRLPWNLSMIKLPWMQDILKVEWR